MTINKLVANSIISINTNQLTGNIDSTQLEPTGVTPSTYGGIGNIPVVVINQQGRITSASNIVIEANVTSVNGLTGVVVLSTANISESANLYYTNVRVYSNVIQLDYVNNTYVNTNFAGNTYVQNNFASNTYVNTRLDTVVSTGKAIAMAIVFGG